MADVKVTVRISQEDYDKIVQWFEMSEGINVPDFRDKCPRVQVYHYDKDTVQSVKMFSGFTRK